MTERWWRASIRAAAFGLVAGLVTAVTPVSAGLAPSGDATVVDQTPLVYYYDVAYNPERDEYLGVYRVGTGPTDSKIMMVRLDADGAVLTGPTVAVPVQASPREVVSSAWATPRVVYNAAQNQYLVVFLRNDGGNANPADNRSSSVYGRLISSLGVPVGSEAKLATTSGNNTACVSRYPDVVVDPNTGGYLLAFNQWHATNVGICGDLSPYERKNVLVPLTSSLGEGAAISVPTSSSPRNALEPRLAHNPVTNQFMVAQRDDTGVGSARIFTAGLSPAGVVDIDDFPANGAGGAGGITGSTPAADPVTGNWLVASSTDFQSVITTNLISSAGVRLRSAVTTTAGGIPTELVALGNGRWVVGTTAGRVVQLAADGAVQGDQQPFTGNLRFIGIAANGGNADQRIVAFGPTTNLATVVVLDVVDALVPLVPARVLETRSGPDDTTSDGQFEGIGRRGAGTTLELKVTGRGGVPADADAVMLNVTAVFPDAAGFLTVFPCGTSLPKASNVNYGPGEVVPNAVLAKVGAGGKVCVYTLAATDVIVDVNGYVPAGGTPSSLVPARVLETRSGPDDTTSDGQFEGIGRRGAGTTLELKVTGRGGVPADADAVMLNVTAVFPDAAGFLTVFPCGTSLPKASNVNYGPGEVVPNAVLAKVGAGGKVCVYTLAATDVIVDVNGYVPAP
jgi:hypothetical protein